MHHTLTQAPHGSRWWGYCSNHINQRMNHLYPFCNSISIRLDGATMADCLVWKNCEVWILSLWHFRLMSVQSMMWSLLKRTISGSIDNSSEDGLYNFILVSHIEGGIFSKIQCGCCSASCIVVKIPHYLSQ